MLIDNTTELRFLELSGFLTHPPAKFKPSLTFLSQLITVILFYYLSLLII